MSIRKKTIGFYLLFIALLLFSLSVDTEAFNGKHTTFKRNLLGDNYIVSLFFIVIISILIVMLYMKKNYRDHIYQLAYIDRETGLWNIYKFEEEATEIINENSGISYSVISLDVSRFSIINNRYGREIGNHIINRISDTLKSISGKDMRIARIKADHFIMLIATNNQNKILKLTENITSKLSTYEYNGTQIKLNINFGVCFVDDFNQSITEAINFAETARREIGNNITHVAFYDDAMKQNLHREKDIEDTMEKALKKGEFKVYYQPKYDMTNYQIIGAEALIRWDAPDKGFLNPEDFIPIFEKNGFIVELDFFILEEVCKLIHNNIRQGRKIYPISVNQSRVHLDQKNYIEELEILITKYEIPHNVIELEITETVFDNYKNALETVENMKRLGFSISVDDFGSGYSSLNLLYSIPLDILKIDKDFLTSIQSSHKARIILKKIVELAKDLQMEVICEGVERQEQMDYLLSIGCQYAQGYLFSRPISQKVYEDKYMN